MKVNNHPANSAPAAPARLPGLRPALQLLLDAYGWARECHRGVWEFAVEMEDLRAVGLTYTDLRWLVCQSYVQHAVEITQAEPEPRLFGPPGQLLFPDHTCCVLTAAGVAWARTLCPAAAANRQPQRAEESTNGDALAQADRPRWDSDLHERWARGRLVLCYRRPAPDQELILAAFQEQGWIARIDNPLSPKDAGEDMAGRLRGAIHRLNRHQQCPLLYFRADGTGEGVRWQFRNKRNNKSLNG